MSENQSPASHTSQTTNDGTAGDGPPPVSIERAGELLGPLRQWGSKADELEHRTNELVKKASQAGSKIAQEPQGPSAGDGGEQASEGGLGTASIASGDYSQAGTAASGLSDQVTNTLGA